MNGIPKTLAPVDGKPFLEHLLFSLHARGINNFILSLGHLSDSVISYLSSTSLPFNIKYFIEKESLGTGGAIKATMEHFNLTETLVVNGDTLLSGDIAGMFNELNISNNEYVRMALVKVINRARYGGVELAVDNSISKFLDKGIENSGYINAGFYRVSRNCFQTINKNIFSFESEILPTLIINKKLTANIISGSFIDIGIPIDYDFFCQNYSNFKFKL